MYMASQYTRIPPPPLLPPSPNLSLPPSLSQTEIQLVAPLSILPPPSAFSLSLYPSICGRDEVTICCSERAWEGLRGREGVRHGGGESERAVLWYCNFSQSRSEVNWGEEKGDMCNDSVTTVKGKEGLTGIERKTGKEKQKEGEVLWYCHCSKAGTGSPLAFDLCLLRSVFVWVRVQVYVWFIVR